MNAIVSTEQHEISAAQNYQVAVGPMANAIAALQAGMTIESLRGIMDLQKEWDANEARKAYVADMAAFKLNPPQILKDKLVGYENRDGSVTGYFHATLGKVVDAVVSALAQHGFSHNWETKQDKGIITVSCKITHRLGHSESTSMESSADVSGKKNAIQAVASSITYLSRYTLLAATGLAPVDMSDDDGEDGGAPITDVQSRQAGQPTDRQEDSLSGKGYAAASHGMPELTKWWGTLTAKQRSELNTEFPKMRAIAGRVAQGGNHE